MSGLDLSWAPAGHREKVEALVPHLADACAKAETSKRFIAIQLDPKAEWKGWPHEVAEVWLNKRPSILFRYYAGEATAEEVAGRLRALFNNTYRPRTGNGPGMPRKEPVKGLRVPVEVSNVLDEATWDAMRKSGAFTDLDAIRQAVTLPKERDEAGDDAHAVIQSAGTVTGPANKARYTSVRGDLYWADIRNTLEVWIMARPELVAEFLEWQAAGEPRAWEEGGEWIEKGPRDRREHNPLVHIRTSAHRTALKAVSQWRNDGTISLDSILDGGGWDAVREIARPKPERAQHKAPTGQERYTWGLRDRVDCYTFPVETRRMPNV